MVSMVNAGRDENQSVNWEKAQEDARDIFEVGCATLYLTQVRGHINIFAML